MPPVFKKIPEANYSRNMGPEQTILLYCTSQLPMGGYALLQKKRNISEPVFPGDPGSLTLTLHYKVHLSTLFPRGN